MADKQKKKSATKQPKAIRSSISYLYLIGLSVTMTMAAILLSSGGTWQFLGMHVAADMSVEPAETTGACESIDEAGFECSDSKPITVQTETIELEGKLESISDSDIEEKTDIKKDIQEDGDTKAAETETDIQEDGDTKAAETETDIPTTSDKVKPESDTVETSHAAESEAGECQKDSEECGDLPENESREDYAKHDITNDADYKIKDRLDAGDELLEKGNYKEALPVFDAILGDYPFSPRALWGKGLAMDDKATALRSNQYLEEALKMLGQALREPSNPPALIKKIGVRLGERQEFRGMRKSAASTLAYLGRKFPDDFDIQHKYGVSFLLLGDDAGAKAHFEKTLKTFPDSGRLKCLLGFSMRNEEEEGAAIPFLREGIESGDEGTIDGRFFHCLGDAYIRTGQREKADEIFALGVEKGVFLSHYQRSQYNADTPITGRSWWTIEQTTYQDQFAMLEANWETIRDEGVALMEAGLFQDEAENLRETGDWKQFMLYLQGKKIEKNCEKCPKTCALFEKFTDSTSCRRGQIKYSIMMPGVHVWPHVGPTNCRVRAHLGLVVPEGPRIRVVNDTRTWKEGKFIIFDDSFEHEVWHDGDSFRLVLIVDVWHPEIPEEERRSLTPI